MLAARISAKVNSHELQHLTDRYYTVLLLLEEKQLMFLNFCSSSSRRTADPQLKHQSTKHVLQ